MEMAIIGDIFGAIGSNFLCIIFFVIAMIRASSYKSPWVLFIVGIVIQLFSFCGTVTQIIESNEEIQLENIAAFIIFIIFATTTFFVIKKDMSLRELIKKGVRAQESCAPDDASQEELAEQKDIMKYNSQLNTPLKFHKFFWYFLLPVRLIFTLQQTIETFSGEFSFNWVYAIALSLYIITLSLVLACFIGFFTWKSYAWYSVIAYLSVSVLTNIYTVILCAYVLPDELGTAIAELMGALTFAVIVGIYYKKRKPLFFSALYQSSADASGSQKDSNDNTSKEGACALAQVSYCRKCGVKLLENSDFCSRCGTPLIKEEIE